MSPSAPLLPHFSNLPEIAFLHAHDRLCHRLTPAFLLSGRAFPSAVLAASSSGVLTFSFTLISSGLSLAFSICTFYSNYISSANTHPYLCSHVFLETSILQLHFFFCDEEDKDIFFNCSETPRYISTRLFQSELDLLILSIYLIFPFLSVDASRRRFSFFVHRPDVSLGAGNVKALHSFSFHPLRARPLRLTNPFSSFSLPSTTLPVCPQQICTLL